MNYQSLKHIMPPEEAYENDCLDPAFLDEQEAREEYENEKRQETRR